MRTESQDEPGEPELVAGVYVPIVFGHLVVSKKRGVHFHCGVAHHLRNNLFELYSEKVSLEQKSNHHRCYRVNDD